MAANVMKGASTTATIVIVVAILLVVNLISINLFGRADLTDNEIYSLSDASIDLMENLSDRVVVKCYFSDDLPPPYNQNSRYLKDQLADYRAYSGGRLEFEFVDPAKSDREQEAQSYQVPPVQVNAYDNDRLEIKKVYMGLVFLHGDKTEVMPVIESTIGLEYEISRAIKKVISAKTPRIAFVTGHGEPDLQSGLRVVNQALSRDYAIQPLDLSQQTEIPKNIDAVLVVAPRQPFSQWDLFVLDRYLMNGGKLGLFIDRFECDIQGNNATPVDAGLDKLLRRYGIGINSDLVLDARCSRIGVQQQTGFFRIQNMVEFRYFPMITNFYDENVIVKGLDGLSFIFISSLDTNVAVPENVTREVLAWSSELSRTEAQPFNFDPYRKFSRSDFDKQNLPLAVILKGQFPSLFADRDIPAYTGMDTTFTTASLEPIDSSATTRMLVIGDGDFVDDRNMRSQANLVFFMNVVDWLSQDEGLISIRSKQIASRPLDEVSDGMKRFTKYFNILGVPFMVIAVGVIRWRMRVSRKKRRLL